MPADLKQRLTDWMSPQPVRSEGQITSAETVRAVGSAVTTAANGASATAERAVGGVSLIQGMGLLVAGVLIVGISQFIFGGHLHQAAQQTAGSDRQAAPLSAFTIVGNVDLGSEFSGEIARLGQTLAGVTDIASAEAALPPLQNIAGSLAKMRDSVGRLPNSGQAKMADLAARSMPLLQVKFNKVCAIPGVADVLNPVLDRLMASIGNLARRPT